MATTWENFLQMKHSTVPISRAVRDALGVTGMSNEEIRQKIFRDRLNVILQYFLNTKGFTLDHHRDPVNPYRNYRVDNKTGISLRDLYANRTRIIFEFLLHDPELLWVSVEISEVQVSLLAVFLEGMTDYKVNLKWEEYVPQILELVSSYVEEQNLSPEHELQLRETIADSILKYSHSTTGLTTYLEFFPVNELRLVKFIFQDLVQSQKLIDEHIIDLGKCISWTIWWNKNCNAFLDYLIHTSSEGYNFLYLPLPGTYCLIERIRMSLLPIKNMNTYKVPGLPNIQYYPHFYGSTRNDGYTYNQYLLSLELIGWIQEPRVYKSLTRQDIFNEPWFREDMYIDGYFSVSAVPNVGPYNARAIQRYKEQHVAEIEEYFLEREAQLAWDATNTLNELGFAELPVQGMAHVAENSDLIERNARRVREQTN